MTRLNGYIVAMASLCIAVKGLPVPDPDQTNYVSTATTITTVYETIGIYRSTYQRISPGAGFGNGITAVEQFPKVWTTETITQTHTLPTTITTHTFVADPSHPRAP